MDDCLIRTEQKVRRKEWTPKKPKNTLKYMLYTYRKIEILQMSK